MFRLIFKDVRESFGLSAPLILNLLAYMAMQLVDTIMAGKLGHLALASMSVANIVYLIIFVICTGILSAVGTLTAQAYGRGSIKKVTRVVQQGLWIALIVSIPSFLLIWNIDKYLTSVGQDQMVANGAGQFLHGIVWGFFPTLCFFSLREFITAIAKPKIIILISTLAIPLNVFANYIFIYGKWGFPRLGLMGVGLATAIVDWLMLASLVLFIGKNSAFHEFKIMRMHKPRWVYIRKILRLGFPVGIALCVEECLFVVVALMMGHLGVVPLAAHQIALQCMMIAVMISIGIAQAAAVRVSFALGSGENKKAVFKAYMAITTGFLLATLAALVFWLFGKSLANLFLNPAVSTNRPVLELATQLLMIVAIFHIIDAIQIITNGILRGFQDTLVPMLIGFISFWMMGVGSGYVLGFRFGYGAVGLWWGLAIGITVSALLLQWRLYTQCARVLYLPSEITTSVMGNERNKAARNRKIKTDDCQTTKRN